MKRICKICGKTFMTCSNAQKYCSTECSAENTRRLQRKRYAAKRAKTPKPSRICIICGKTFTPHNNAQKCCSTECMGENYHRHQAKYKRLPKHLVIAVPKKFQGRIAICHSCGHKFKQTFTNEKFCSDQCRADFWKHYGLKVEQEAVSL